MAAPAGQPATSHIRNHFRCRLVEAGNDPSDDGDRFKAFFWVFAGTQARVRSSGHAANVPSTMLQIGDAPIGPRPFRKDAGSLLLELRGGFWRCVSIRVSRSVRLRHERLRANIRLSPGQGEKRMPTQAEIRIAFWTRQLVHCESIVAKQDIIVVMLENLGSPTTDSRSRFHLRIALAMDRQGTIEPQDGNLKQRSRNQSAVALPNEKPADVVRGGSASPARKLADRGLGGAGLACQFISTG